MGSRHPVYGPAAKNPVYNPLPLHPVYQKGLATAGERPVARAKEAFKQRYMAEAQAVQPLFVDTPSRGTLYAERNKRLSIREAARRRVNIRFVYTKITDGKTGIYECSPYSYRYERLKVGYRVVLYAFHHLHGRIHKFVLANVRNVQVTNKVFTPLWVVEI